MLSLATVTLYFRILYRFVIYFKLNFDGNKGYFNYVEIFLKYIFFHLISIDVKIHYNGNIVCWT